jgi:hypothetical protein
MKAIKGKRTILLFLIQPGALWSMIACIAFPFLFSIAQKGMLMLLLVVTQE